jgi:ABC-type transporter Mla subunit MlaD
MPFQREHELHRRRLGRNVGLAVALGLFALLVFGMAVVKVQHQNELRDAGGVAATSTSAAGQTGDGK